MDILIYTRDDLEYERLRRVMEAQAGYINAHRDRLDGGGHLKRDYDAVVLAGGDGENLELLGQWKRRHPATPAILVMDGEAYQADAMRLHAFDYLLRPVRDERVAKTTLDMLPFCPDKHCFYFPAKEVITDEI